MPNQVEILKQLSGHSGCKVYLCRDKKRHFIRKFSGDVNYNSRLQKQVDKQNLLRKIILDSQIQNVKVPEVYEIGYHNDFFYFDMEYIVGMTLTDFIPTAKIRDVSSASYCISEILSTLKQYHFHRFDKENEVDIRSVFLKKIMDLEKRFKVRGIFHDYECSFLELSKLPLLCNQLRPTHCFVDLSLDNIIISNAKELTFIDTLDSFFESYLMDVSKFLMDLESGWSFRFVNVDENTRMRMYVLKESFCESIDKLNINWSLLNLLKLMHAMRIIPYTEDESSLALLNRYIDQMSCA